MKQRPVRRPKSETRNVLDVLEKAVIVLDQNFYISFLNSSAHVLLDLSQHRTFNGFSLMELLEEHGWKLESEQKIIRKTLETAVETGATIDICKPVARYEKKYKTFKIQPFQTAGLKGYICEITKSSELKRELQSQKTFIRMIGHEAKQPLSIMKAYLYRLKKNPTEKQTAELLEHLNFQVDNIANMLTELAESLKMRNKRFEVVKEKTKIREIFMLATKEVQDIYPKQKFRFQLRGCDSNTIIELDKIRFAQVVRNIISNAVKYGTPNAMIYLSGNCTQDGLHLTFTNYGDDIPEDALLTIFDPYIRNHSTREKKGIGLGLYIVREIVNQHGGSIKVESKKGKTAFFVRFPRH